MLLWMVVVAEMLLAAKMEEMVQIPMAAEMEEAAMAELQASGSLVYIVIYINRESSLGSLLGLEKNKFDSICIIVDPFE